MNQVILFENVSEKVGKIYIITQKKFLTTFNYVLSHHLM